MAREVGNVDTECPKGGKVVEAAYYTPLLAHAPMEPPAAVAEFKDGKVITWANTQNPQAVQDTVAKALGISKEAVTCHVTLLGGGFGRKSKPDYVAEAALLSRQVGKPVKIVWGREDDLPPLACQLVHEGDVGRGWQAHCLAAAQCVPAHCHAERSERGVRWVPARNGLDGDPVRSAESASGERAGQGADPHRVAAIGANIYHAFGVQSFTDEPAAAAGRDRVEYLLELIGAPREIDFTKEGMKGRRAQIRSFRSIRPACGT